ncbi:MAG: ABC transporter permease [Solirubrobacteraceae bacterium]
MSVRLNPRVAGVRLSMLLHLYRVRLRSHAVQELLAGGGIAVGVALVLGVLVANTSLTSSAGELVHEVSGSARLVLSSRSPEGFDELEADGATGLPGVSVGAPVLRENVAVVGPGGRAAVQLLGVTPQVLRLGGFASGLNPETFSFSDGLMLPTSVAAAIGVQPGDTVRVLARGHAGTIKVSTLLGSSQFGAMASSQIAVTMLNHAQQLTALPGRVTQLYVTPRAGEEARVQAALTRVAAGKLNVTSAGNELRLLEQAAHPNDQSTELFAAISVMVGFLLALNAMLLTVPERRRFVADLRMQGYDWRQILVLLGFQAVVLGLLASLAGVLLGDLLSHAFLHRVPTYLSTAFPVGSHQVLHAQTVLAALGCGVMASLLASLTPALDLRPSRPTDAVLHDREGGSEALSARTTWRATALCGVSLALVTAAVLLEPGLTIAGGVALALSTLCALPLAFAALARVLRFSGERLRSSALIVVVSELRATTTRAVALAGIAALAVYGSVAIGGARDDLLRGLDANFGEYLQTADLWVTTGGNDLTTNSFDAAGAAAALRRAPGVASVGVYQGGFLDVGARRMWVIARPPGDSPLLPASQLVSGELAQAEARLAAGGWAAASVGFARERDLHLGDAFTIPTPSGATSLRLAAITTNLGWAAGALIVSQPDYQRWWATVAPSAFEVHLRPGVSGAAGRRAALDALGFRPGLGVQTLAERRSQYRADARQGLQALSQIATLLLIAAALAVASALSAAIWQRRARLASLKIQGYGTAQLWRALLLESAVVLGVGCLIGAVFGVYGHALASRWLRLATGFPAPFSIGFAGVFLTLAMLALIALAVVSLPGLAAARAPARASFQE